MTEKNIKSFIRSAELKHGIKKGLLEAVAYIEYARLYGWTDSKIQELHSDGTSFGLFGLREHTSVAEYLERNSITRSELTEKLKTVRGQCEVAGWYLGRRIPQMLRHYKLPQTTENKIISYNAGISKAINGQVPEITRQYILDVNKYLAEHRPPVSWGWLGLFGALIAGYFIL